MRRGTRQIAMGLIALSSVGATLALEDAPRPTWTAVDHTDLFLHDLTEGPATFAGAFVTDEQGNITSTFSPISEVKFAHGSAGVIAARSDQPVALESAHDRVILVNATEHTIAAYFQTGSVLREIRLLPDEGVAIGKLTVLASNRFRKGCLGACETEDGVRRPVSMFCSDVFADHDETTHCNCRSLEGTNCWAYDEERNLLDGKIVNCRSGLLPVEPDR
jgi:hypothetical protein